MAALSIAFAQLSAASQCLPNRPAVTVQIRDHARHAGVPVACVRLNNARNAAILAAQILGA